MSHRSIFLEVINENALSFRADLLVLKYAQGLFGLDYAVFQRLNPEQQRQSKPDVWNAVTHDTHDLLGADRAMFIGVPPLNELDYGELRVFSRTACRAIKSMPHPIQHMAWTIHGPGYGLHENEAFESLLGGIFDAVKSDEFPPQLRQISFVERDRKRADRLMKVLKGLLPDGRIQLGRKGILDNSASGAETATSSAGTTSDDKPRVFVAMPFSKDKDDTYHYGIQGAVHAAELLCERADLAAFSGDVNEWVKRRIESARLVVADLSNANPNVYLEVGYAWGRGVQTVLLCDNLDSLKFDVRSQRCIHYESIHDLEEKLFKELKALLA